MGSARGFGQSSNVRPALLREGTVKIPRSGNDMGRYPGLSDFCRLLIHSLVDNGTSGKNTLFRNGIELTVARQLVIYTRFPINPDIRRKPLSF